MKSIATDPLLRVVLGSLMLVSTTCLASSSIASDEPVDCAVRMQAAFTEGAPRDLFSFTNNSTAGWSVKFLNLNLRESAGKLVFDTQEGGDGLEVFQAFRAESQSPTIASINNLRDGDQRIDVVFGNFPSGDTFAFSIDVDDQLTNSELGQIQVSGSEIRGALLSVGFVHSDGRQKLSRGRFGGKATAHLSEPDC